MFEDTVESQGPIDSREGEARKMEPVVSSILSVTTHGLCTFRKASESADQGYSSKQVNLDPARHHIYPVQQLNTQIDFKSLSAIYRGSVKWGRAVSK